MVNDYNTPTVTATARLVRGVWLLKLVCPHCGKTHIHGGGGGPMPFGGHRVAHCEEPPNGGYFIELPDWLEEQKAKVRHDKLR